MLNNIKQFVSKFTDKPIYKGPGVTTTSDITGMQSASEEVTVFRLNGTDYLYCFQRVSVGKRSGVIYYILERIDIKEEMVLSANVFNEIFTRIA